MNIKKIYRVFGTAVFIIFLVLSGFFSAAGEEDCSKLADQIGHGGILWTENAIIRQGTAPPDLSDSTRSIALIKRLAKRVATLDAFRKAAGILSGVRLTGKWNSSKQREIRARISAYVRNIQICNPKFYADGGVDMVVQIPLTGAFSREQLVSAGTDVATSESNYTGLIIDASGKPGTPESFDPEKERDDWTAWNRERDAALQ